MKKKYLYPILLLIALTVLAASNDQKKDNIEKLKQSIPEHLKEFIVEQDQTKYTPMDHATWRYSLRQLKNFLGEKAHQCYLDGLEKTGITVEDIPSIDMDSYKEWAEERYINKS